MSMESLAKETAILEMLERFLVGRQSDINTLMSGFLGVAEEHSLAAVTEACYQYREGLVPGQNLNYYPNLVQFAAECRRHAGRAPIDPTDNRDMRQLVIYPQGGKPPPGTRPAGMLSIDFGHGKIDLSRMTHEQQEEVLRSKGRNRLAGPAGKVPALKTQRM